MGRDARTIFLIRHGETEGNAARIVQLPDAPLSPRGIAQAERLAHRLAVEGIALILSSDLERAMTTAEHVRRATGAPIAFDPLLQERNFGVLRGTPYAELNFDPFASDYEPPTGETWPIFHARVDRAWEAIQARAAAVETLKPGKTSSVTQAPPTTARRSSTSTRRPPRARSHAATSPLWPAPTTIASYAPAAMTALSSVLRWDAPRERSF